MIVDINTEETSIVAEARCPNCGGRSLMRITDRNPDLSREFKCPHCPEYYPLNRYEFMDIRPVHCHPEAVETTADLDDYPEAEGFPERRREAFLRAVLKAEGNNHVARNMGITVNGLYSLVYDAREDIDRFA